MRMMIHDPEGLWHEGYRSGLDFAVSIITDLAPRIEPRYQPGSSRGKSLSGGGGGKSGTTRSVVGRGTWNGRDTVDAKNRWGDLVSVYVDDGTCIDCGRKPEKCSGDDHK